MRAVQVELGREAVDVVHQLAVVQLRVLHLVDTSERRSDRTPAGVGLRCRAEDVLDEEREPMGLGGVVRHTEVVRVRPDDRVLVPDILALDSIPDPPGVRVLRAGSCAVRVRGDRHPVGDAVAVAAIADVQLQTAVLVSQEPHDVGHGVAGDPVGQTDRRACRPCAHLPVFVLRRLTDVGRLTDRWCGNGRLRGYHRETCAGSTNQHESCDEPLHEIPFLVRD